MNIIVCVKQVPGTNQVEVDPVTGVLKRDGVAGKLNPYDLFALETAFALAERYGGSVKTVTMGPPQARAALEETLWMGADEAVLLTDRKFGGADVAATSNTLAHGIRALGDFDLLICGKQTTDGDTAQVGPELAEQLGIEHAANVTEAEPEEDGIRVTVNMDDVIMIQKMRYPCLITIDKDANTPRLPSFRRKFATGDGAVKVLTADDLEGTDAGRLGLKGSPTRVERIFPPESSDSRELFEGTSAELAEGLYSVLKSRKFL
jgi:electron transfer flavoprotein beta subunit